MAPQLMPLQGSSKAPKFEGDPANLVQFLEDVEFLCEDVQLSLDKDYIKWAMRYASRDEAELWKTVAPQVKGDWGLFKKVVLGFYPGAEEDNDCKYSRTDLDRIVAAQVEISMNSHAILGEYIRKFTVVASFLEGKGHISKGECEAKFLSRFHPTFKAQLMNRLTLAYLEHHPDDP